MYALRICLLVAFLAVAANCQGNIDENRCLKLFRSGFSESQFFQALGTCTNAARALQNKIKKPVLIRLTSRCIGLKLKLATQKGDQVVPNKPLLLSAIDRNPEISEQERREFRERINNCQDFDRCVAQDCGV